MVSEVVMKSHDKAVLLRNVSISMRGGAHSKIFQNLAAGDLWVLNFPFIKSRGVLLF